MGSWWRQIALEAGAESLGSGSWKRRAATALGISPGTQRGSWPRIITLAGDLQQQTGASWARRLTPTDAPHGQSWSRKLYLSGGLGGSPLDLEGLIAWGDFSDADTLFQTDDESTPITVNGQSIGRVSDKSGLGNHFIRAAQDRRPTYLTGVQNGRSVAAFSPSVLSQHLHTDVMELGGTTASVFVVVKGQEPNDNARAVVFQGDGDSNDFGNTTSGIFIYYPNEISISGFRDNVQLSNGSIVDDTFNVIGSVYDGVNHTLYINGVAQAPVVNDDTFKATGRFSLGAWLGGVGVGGGTDGLTGQVAEFVITNTALDVDERAFITAYLMDKWGLL